jgi:hypothetical protein
MKNQRTWENQFGSDFEIPAEITSVMRDTSWCNDMTPTFEPTGQTDKHDPHVELWADHAKREMREVQDGKRYWVTVASRDGNDVETIIETDDAAEAVRAAAERFNLLYPSNA